MVEIRPATRPDHGHLRRIQQAALAEDAPQLLESGVGGTLGLLAAVDADPVGYSLFLPGGRKAILLELAVEPSRQGDGIGTKLVEETLSRLERDGHESVHLTARQSDQRVHEFYERQDFERGERIPDFFESDDGVVFVREL